MKQIELKQHIEHICNYIIGGIESEVLRAKYKELCEARARARAVEMELKAMLARYE